ncbi:trehalose synthase [Caballeronia pedi]|uniref:Trehalose synthase n=1 Tax=Caballeronia pedi TaxID=1777141 RepID=A0A158E754_9BURK|nr:putative maltokinase [Caballeronia pedi]SAL01787.1 trehalose synthase [Caballeronia pedi]
MDNEEELRVRAYYLWEAAGRPNGEADEHWAQAEQDAAAVSHVLVSNDLSSLLTLDNLALLEKEVLPGYLMRRRWFAAKDRKVDAIRVMTPATAIDQTGLLAQIEVTINDSIERYSIPLAIVWDERSPTDDDLRLARDMALASVRGEQRSGILTDAFFDPAFVRALVGKTNAGAVVGSPEGARVDFVLEPGAKETIGLGGDIRWLSTEQSNTSVIVGGRIVMKLMRRLQSGVHPEAEMCRFLTRAGYRNSSPLLAEIVHTDDDGVSRSIAVLEGFVANDGDAWTYAIECLRDALKEDVAATSEPRDGKASDGSARLQEAATVIGRRLGELHAALASPDGNPAFAPEAVESKDIEVWKEAAISQLERALDIVDGQRGIPSSVDTSLIEKLTQGREQIIESVRGAVLPESSESKTRIHGDFHLGQVLWANGDVCIIDFEGEPARPIESRRAKANPMRDVAGLLRSIAYAAAFVARQEDDSSSESCDPANRESRLETLRRGAEVCFLKAYSEVADRDVSELVDENEVSLLRLYLVEKAAYEVCYEAANRPEWIAIPLRGLARALAAFSGKENSSGKGTIFK